MTVVPAGVSVRLLYPFAAVLGKEGVSDDTLLRASSLPENLFRDPDARVSYELAARFVRAAVARTAHRALGLEAAKNCDAAQFQLLEYLVASSPRVETAIADLVRYQSLLADLQVLSIERQGENLLLRYQPPAPPPRVSVEFVLGSLVLTALRSLGSTEAAERVNKTAIVSVCFSCPVPEEARQAYAHFFGPHVRYDAAHNGILITDGLARHKITRANRGVHELLETQVKSQLRAEAQIRPFSDRARALIADGLTSGALCQDRVARALHVSRTTLKRRLAAEGTHFRALVDLVRKEVALRAIQLPALSVLEVAQRAGYDDATAFNKAFKRWTGSSPAKHRARKCG